MPDNYYKTESLRWLLEEEEGLLQLIAEQQKRLGWAQQANESAQSDLVACRVQIKNRIGLHQERLAGYGEDDE